jgi:hypothetical protein
MRYVIIVVGLLLIGAGVAIWFGRFHYPDEVEALKVGGFAATMTMQRPVPQWLGAVTALTGLAIALLGTRYRR